MVTKTINGTTYDSDTSFAGYSYVPNILTLAGDIMVEADARSGAVAQFTFSTTTTDADPGAGLLGLNQATQNTATVVYVDLADADGADVTALLDAFDDSTSATKGWLMLRQRNDKTKWLLFRLTAVTSASGYRKLTVVLIASSTASPFADGAPLLMGFVPTGDRGWPADGFRWIYSTTTADADPGAGTLRLNNATQNAATQAFVDLADADGATQTTWLDSLDDASGTKKGRVRLAAQSDPTRFITGALTAVTTASGYRKLVFTVLSSSGSTPFTDGEALFVSFQPAGDDGDVTGPASSTSNGIATWNGTGGSALLSTAWTVVANVMTAGGALDMGAHDATLSTATVSTLLTVSAGMQSGSLPLGDVSGDVVIEASDPLHIYCTITGDTTFLVAGGTVPGTSHDHLIHYTMGGAGGYAVATLPANEIPSYSADFQSTAEAGESRPWVDTNSSLDDNAAVGPDGQTTLTKLIEDAGGAALHMRTRTLTGLSPNQALTLSVIVKDAGDGRGLRLEMYDADSASNAIGVFFNPTTGATHGAYAGGAGVNTSQTVTALPNSCYRVDLYGQPNTSGSTLAFNLLLIETVSGTQGTYAGDGTSGGYLGEAQVVKGTPVGIAHVGATRAGQVVVQGTATDFPAMAAAATGDLAISIEPDGRIVVQDHTVEEL